MPSQALNTPQIPPQVQQAIQAIISGNTAYFAQLAQQWQDTGASAHSEVSERQLGTGGLSASNNSLLDKLAPVKQKEAFNPGVPTQRGLPA